jgi:inositol phosphorylceramide mannosyltransferase catalytic subunit
MRLPNVPGEIPRIFHQSWSSTELPAKMKTWSRGCKEVHPDWQHVLWTDEDNLKLIQKHFASLLPTYLALKSPIVQADFMRNVYMFLYGG